MKITGRNAVKEALNSDVTIDRLVVEKGMKDISSNAIINSARDKGIRITFLDKQVMDKENKDVKHQGFVAEITDYKYSTVEEIMNEAAAKKEKLFMIILDGVEDPHNLGSIIRVAECSGVHGIIIPRHRAVSVNDTVIRVSAGASAHMKIAKVTNVNDTIRELKEQNIKVLAAETGGKSIYESDLTGELALVIGGEDSGVKRLTRELCDGIITLPMFGQINSLNASVACGVVVYEAIRQRRTN